MNICKQLENVVTNYVDTASEPLRVNDDALNLLMDYCESVEASNIFDDGDACVIIVSDEYHNVVMSFASPEIDFFTDEPGMPDLIDHASMCRFSVDDGYVVLSLVFNGIIE